MKLLTYVLMFFILQGAVLVIAKDRMIDTFGRNWPVNFQSNLQKDALLGIQRIVAANKEGKPKYFVVGPSSSPPFYAASQTLAPNLRNQVISLYSGSQVLPDAIRLIEKMEVPGSTVAMVITPHKFGNMWYDRALVETHYLNGMAAKYMSSSQTLEKLWKEFRAGHDVTSMVWTQNHWRFFQPFMPYVYYLNDIVDHNIKQPIKRWKKWLKISSSRKSRKISKNPEQTTNKKNVPPTKAKLPEYNGHISARKLKEFRIWRDFSKPQFKQSVQQSFVMLELLIKLAKERGLEFIVVEAPYPDVEEQELVPFLPDYRKKMNGLEKKYPNVRVIQFNPKLIKNDQKYFSDYVHLNKRGKDFYKDYLLSPFRDIGKKFDSHTNLSGVNAENCLRNQYFTQIVPKDIGAPPLIDWSNKDVTILHNGQFNRTDLIEKHTSLTFDKDSKHSGVGNINLNGLNITSRRFVDTLIQDAAQIKFNRQNEQGNYLLSPGDAAFMNIEYVAPMYHTASLLTIWQSTNLKDEKRLHTRTHQHYATPFGWAFRKGDLKKITSNVCFHKQGIAPGYSWTQSENIDLPFNINSLTLKIPKKIKQVKAFFVREKRQYSASSDGLADFSNSRLQVSMSSINSRGVGKKIANSGLEITIHDVVSVGIVGVAHTFSKISGSFKKRIGSMAPHSIFLELSNGHKHTLMIHGVELIDLDFDKKTTIFRISAYNYHASQRSLRAYDLRPMRVLLQKNVLHIKRKYRNFSITDFIPDGQISMSVEDQQRMAFPVWQPNARLATVTFMEHADYQDERNDHLIMYGNAKREIIKGQGILGNQIPYTKTVFLKGKPLTFSTYRDGRMVKVVQPTFAQSKIFAKDLLDYYNSGLVEIAAHQSGTTPYANETSAANRSLALLSKNFAGRIWTDHGGIPSNISFNGWDRSLKQYGVLNALRANKIDYAWPVGDKSPICHSTVKPDQSVEVNVCNTSLLRDDEASSVLYDVPMLSQKNGKRKIKFFRNVILPGVNPKHFIKFTGPLIKQNLLSLIDHRGATILHFYPGQTALVHNKIDGKVITSLKAFWNSGLARLAKYRDNGLIHLAKTSDWLDYITAMRKTEVLSTGNYGLLVNNPGLLIKGATFAVLSKSGYKNKENGENGTDKNCVVHYFSTDLDKGQTFIGLDKIVRSLKCGTPLKL